MVDPLTVLRPMPVVGKTWALAWMRIVGRALPRRREKPGVALLFRRASALALVGMAAFTDIVITRRRAGWPVRRVSVRSRITRQSPAYAPFVAFADVSVAPPTIASADTASRIRFITVSTPIGETWFCYWNFKFPEILRNHFADLIPADTGGGGLFLFGLIAIEKPQRLQELVRTVN